MNSSTCKLIRRYASRVGSDPKKLRQLYHTFPAPSRGAIKRHMKAVVAAPESIPRENESDGEREGATLE